MPPVAEFPKAELLAYEKEILGVYLSGHPMDEYLEIWKNSVTARTTDFLVDEETGRAAVADGARVRIGGMIAGKVVKTTKTGKMMAFLTVEDLVGSVEVLVFPRDYENKRQLMNEDDRVFIEGRASIGDDPVGKLICEQVIPFDAVPRELWLKFAGKDEYDALSPRIMDILKTSEGSDTVVLYLERERAKKILPASWKICANKPMLEALSRELGEKNVKLVEKGLKR